MRHPITGPLVRHRDQRTISPDVGMCVSTREMCWSSEAVAGYSPVIIPGWRGYPARPNRCRGPRVSIDERPVALPKLYGAPAYARPPAPVSPSPRPFDPDQLPLQVYQTEDERRYAELMPAHAYTRSSNGGGGEGPRDASANGLRPRRFNLRAIAGRLLGGE